MDRSAGFPLRATMVAGLAVAVALGVLAWRTGGGSELRTGPLPQVVRDTANPAGEVPLVFPLHPVHDSAGRFQGPGEVWDATQEARALGHRYGALSVELLRRPARLAVTVDGTRHRIRLPAAASHQVAAVLLPGREGPGIVGRLHLEDDDPVRHWWWVGWVDGEPRLLDRPRLYAGPAEGYDPLTGFRASIVVSVVGDLYSLFPRGAPERGPVRTHVRRWEQQDGALHIRFVGEFCVDAQARTIEPTVAGLC